MISQPAVYSLSLFILSLPCFLPLTFFPLPSPAACHGHMPGSSVSSPPAPLGHGRKLMLTVSLEAAATSLGATVAPDLLSANNPRARKGERRLGLCGSWLLSRPAAPGRGPAGGCLLSFSPPPSRLGT